MTFSEAVPEAVFDHVAHAAPSMKDLAELYVGQFGATFLNGGPNARVGYRAAQFRLGQGHKIELMEPIEGSTFFDSFFRRNPAGGLHHITLRVPDLIPAVERAERAGFSVIGTYLEPEHGRGESFLHPRTAHGALIQLLDAPDSYPPEGLGGSFEQVLVAT